MICLEKLLHFRGVVKRNRWQGYCNHIFVAGVSKLARKLADLSFSIPKESAELAARLEEGTVYREKVYREITVD